MTMTCIAAPVTAAIGVHSPIQINTAAAQTMQRASELAVSGRSPAICATATNESPAANRSIKSPSPGHELGNVEKSLCTPYYETGVQLRDNPQKGEPCITPKPTMARGPLASGPAILHGFGLWHPVSPEHS